MKAYTDYPFSELGDIPCKESPVRLCEVTGYDGNKYCTILVDGIELEVKAGYLYKEAGRCGDVPVINITDLTV